MSKPKVLAILLGTVGFIAFLYIVSVELMDHGPKLKYVKKDAESTILHDKDFELLDKSELEFKSEKNLKPLRDFNKCFGFESTVISEIFQRGTSSKLETVVHNIHGKNSTGELYRFHYTPIEFHKGNELKLVVLKDDPEYSFEKMELPSGYDANTSLDKLFDLFEVVDQVFEEGTYTYSNPNLGLILKTENGKVKELNIDSKGREFQCESDGEKLSCSCSI